MKAGVIYSINLMTHRPNAIYCIIYFALFHCYYFDLTLTQGWVVTKFMPLVAYLS